MIHLIGKPLSYFVDIVRRDHADWPITAIYWQAKRMQERNPLLEKAVVAGCDKGRDLRERMEHGLGVWWDALESLTPDERGFVLALVRAEIGAKAKTDGVTLDLVHGAQKAEAYEKDADALAADWRERSSRPDQRVTKVTRL